MTPALVSVLAILGVVVVLLAIDRPRMDAVAVLVICVLPLTGVLTVPEALAGFSDPNIVLIAVMFVIGEGLVRTGVARGLGDWLIARAGSSPARLMALLMAIVCALGSTMSSTAVTAIFIPVVLRICRRSQTPPSQLLMPMSYGALMSGMMTLVATPPNLVVNSELARRGYDGFHFFAFTPFGVPILALGIGYMLFARRWLPRGSDGQQVASRRRPTIAEWVTRYQLGGRGYRLRIQPGSPLAGRALRDLRLRDTVGANLIAIQRHHNLVLPAAATQLQVGDVLFVGFLAPDADIEPLLRELALEQLPLTGGHFTDYSQEIGMAEVIVPADSELVGMTVVKASVRTRFGFSVIGLRRGVEAIQHGLTDEVLRIGDTLLVIGPWKAIRSLQAAPSRDLVPLSLPAEFDDVLPAPGKAPHALAVLALVVAAMISGVVPNAQAALAGCLLMGALGCITFESAYRSIDWKTIVLIVGMMPFSLALQRTGGVELASQALMEVTRLAGASGVLAALFATTMVLGLFISNTATAVLMAPVALSIAERLEASPYPFAMIVALAASTAFMTPVSSPVNTLVVTPGGYRFGDFVRVGVPFALIVMVVSVVMVPWLLPL